MSTVLPLNPSLEERPEPWLLHLLEVNTMNFCTFASCTPVTSSPDAAVLIAVPNTLASEAVSNTSPSLSTLGLTRIRVQIDIFHLPSQSRLNTIKLGDKNGMVMALSLFYRGVTLTLIAAYENGLVIAAELRKNGIWVPIYQVTPHSQPILSLDVSPDKDYFFTSSADSMIVKHPIPQATPDHMPIRETPPSDNATTTQPQAGDANKGASLPSATLASQHQPQVPDSRRDNTIELLTTPLKVVNTKHSGQQSLKIRSDARIFATAGWDSKIRIYSVKTMKEVAVLKWHQVGCYTVSFSSLEQRSDTKNPEGTDTEFADAQADTEPSTSTTLVPKLVELTVRDKRIQQAKTAHWLAAGSKDGKVSLWDVF